MNNKNKKNVPKPVTTEARSGTSRRRRIGTRAFAVLLLAAAAVSASGADAAFGASENDPEGSVRRDSDGMYRYYASTTTTAAAFAGSSATPQIPDGLVVAYEPDFYGPDGAYWEGDEDLRNRAPGGFLPDRSPIGGTVSNDEAETEETSPSSFQGDRVVTLPPGKSPKKSYKGNQTHRIGQSLGAGGGVRGGAAGKPVHRERRRTEPGIQRKR